MVQGSFVFSAYKKKDEATKMRINFRQTNVRYLVVVIAIFVVFGCEYCFDNASVNVKISRPCKNPLKKI
jgi:hypothetical protein